MKTTTLNVNLTPLLKELVESKVRAGHYQNASEVVRAALREMDAGHSGQEDAALQADIDAGFASGPSAPLTPAVWRGIASQARRLRRAPRRKKARAA